MIRRPFDVWLLILSMAGFLALIAGGTAEEPKSPPKASPRPVGLRLVGNGRSWYTENCEPLCKAAGITGHRKNRPAETVESLTPLLENGEIDAYVWCHSSGGPVIGKLLPVLLELGPQHNPHFHGIYVQVPWLVHDGRDDANKFSKTNDEYNQTNLAEMQIKLEKVRMEHEIWADAINAKAGKRIVFLVPLGDAMLEVRKMIAAGKFPGVTKQSGKISDASNAPGQLPSSVLAGDNMPHPGDLARLLGNYMHFAAIYGMSPEGLPWENGYGFNAEQNKILEKLAWDMISRYPYAAISPPPNPKPDPVTPRR